MKQIHFDLRHLPADPSLEARIGGERYLLKAHTAQTIAKAAASHGALALVPALERLRFSHFAEINHLHLRGQTTQYLHVVKPEAEGVHLAQVLAMGILLPEDHLRTFWNSRLELFDQPLWRLRSFHRSTIRRRPRTHSAKLAELRVPRLPAARHEAVAALVQSQTLLTPLDTAGSLVSHHPNLANIQPSTSAIVYNDHILPDPDIDPDQYNRMQLLSTAIQNAGDNWSPVIPCTDYKGNKLTAGYDLGSVFKTGQQLYTYGLEDGVDAQLGPSCGGANRSATNDGRLMNKTWAPNIGTTVLATSNDEASRALRRSSSRTGAKQGAQFKWTVKEQTNHHGVEVREDSITIDGSNNFSIDASNNYLRTLYTGYQLLDDQGRPLGKKEKLCSVSATNTLLGIPMPTDPTSLAFNLGDASAARLYFGSLGTSNWDEDFSPQGALLTGLWQYGIPFVFLLASKAITSTQTFNKIVNDKDLTAAAVGIGLTIVGGGVATAAAVVNTKRVLLSFADVVLAIALQRGMEALGTWLATQVAEGEIASAFGPVGWVFRAAATLMNVEEMVVTTGEVLSSPAAIEVTVGRAIDVALTLGPDPAHGEAGSPGTAVWPTIATHYLATLQYRDGTNFQLSGGLTPLASNAPVDLLFDTVPAGGEFRILAGVYSASGWLAGSWQSDWTTAQPNEGSTLRLGDRNITETLVPLAPDTQYVFKERIAVDGGRFVWQAGEPPTDTLGALACGSAGTLCELVGITINNSAFQVGYAWRSSGQDLPPNSASAPPSNAQLYAMQNLSVLAEPESRLVVSDIGLTNRPGIAYAPSTNQHNEIDSSNFILDPRGGAMNLRRVSLDGTQSNFGLGTANLPSWGSFPLANLDALAVHPSNLVLAASWQDSKLLTLSLPATGTTESDAAQAQLVSGKGIRQGLVRGPKAMAVAPDGRILVLESENMRVQAFDTKGNPVPGFTPRAPIAIADTASLATHLDRGEVAPALCDALIAQGIGFLFTLDTSFVEQLDSGIFAPSNDPLIAALSQNGVILAYDTQAMSDPTLSAQIRIVIAGECWFITDPRGFAWQVSLQNGALNVNVRLAQAQVRVVTAGQEWLVVDAVSLSAWSITPSPAQPGQSQVCSALSFFPLKSMRTGAFTFMDMAVEARGYIYVLSYAGDGSKPADYVLDVYAPNGSFCFRSPDTSLTNSPQNVVAGKLAVDIWRNVYGLTYETLISPSGAPQPCIGHWVPTPPLFSLGLAAQQALNQQNIGEVTQDFTANGFTLSPLAFIEVLDPNGTWQVKDGSTIYHLYRTGSDLQVYAVPA